MARKKRKQILPMLEEMGVDLDELTQQIINILERQKLVSENRLAKRLNLKINAARKLLYRLQSRGLITYVKKRDEKKKWWYLYFWSLDLNRIRELYILYLQRQLKAKKEELAIESKFVFECATCSLKYNYEDALETEFACPQCGDLLAEVKDAKATRKLKRDILSIGTELEEAIRSKPKPKPIIEEEPKPKKRTPKKKIKKLQVKRKPKKKLVKKKIKPKKKKPKPKKKVKKTLAKRSLAGPRRTRSAREPAKKKKKPKPKKKPAKKTKSKSKPIKKKKKSLAKKVLRKILLRKKRK